MLKFAVFKLMKNVFTSQKLKIYTFTQHSSQASSRHPLVRGKSIIPRGTLMVQEILYGYKKMEWVKVAPTRNSYIIRFNQS